MQIVIITLVVSFLIAFILGFLLGVFKRIFYVPTNPIQEKVRAVLPGANCGACGFPGCDGFAEAVASRAAPANGCAAGGAATARAVGEILGVDADAQARITLLACQGTCDNAQPRGVYDGVQTCAAAKLSANGTKLCMYGCIGFGDCIAACKFGALHMAAGGLPSVDYAVCTGCGACMNVCPQKLYALVPADRSGAFARCSNRSANKPAIVKNCKAGCIKCGKCERNCPQHAITITNGIPLVDYSTCTSCGVCIEGCPTHVLALIEQITRQP